MTPEVLDDVELGFDVVPPAIAIEQDASGGELLDVPRTLHDTLEQVPGAEADTFEEMADGRGGERSRFGETSHQLVTEVQDPAEHTMAFAVVGDFGRP